jgi:hypothetical protein
MCVLEKTSVKYDLKLAYIATRDLTDALVLP